MGRWSDAQLALALSLSSSPSPNPSPSSGPGPSPETHVSHVSPRQRARKLAFHAWRLATLAARALRRETQQLSSVVVERLASAEEHYVALLGGATTHAPTHPSTHPPIYSSIHLQTYFPLRQTYLPLRPPRRARAARCAGGDRGTWQGPPPLPAGAASARTGG